MMNFNISKSKIFLSICLGVSVSYYGCKTDSSSHEETEEVTQQADRSKSALLKINGELFSIPSPLQTALLIKENGLTYDKEMLNSPKNINNYSGKFNIALNLGIYGADLGYVTIYEQTQDALSYLGAVKKLADQIGVTAAFDNSLVSRFEKNIDKKDSLLALVSEAYRASDDYLKNNERSDLGALILAGGMIESLHFATFVAKENKSKQITSRIGEQKKTIENLVKLLSPFYETPEFTDLVDSLIELSELFDKIECVYTYNKPIVDVANKTTTLTSTTEIKISEEQLKEISLKINEIRKKITG
jgi:hypothetical protein